FTQDISLIFMKIADTQQEALFSMMDLVNLVHSEEDLTKILDFLVQKIAKLMPSDACSLYLYDQVTDEITLRATHGLNHDLVNNISVKKGQGLAGKTIETLKPLNISNSHKNPDFKEIDGLNEDAYNNYLSVPLIYNNIPIGLIAVQNKEKVKFKKKDIEFLTSLTGTAVALVEKAKFKGTVETISIPSNQINDLDHNENDTTIEYLKDHLIKGIPAVPGIAMGRLKIVHHAFARRHEIDAENSQQKEIELLKEAFEVVSKEIKNTKTKAEKQFGPDEASIFEAYLMFLESESFKKQIIHEINGGLSAVKALDKIVSKYMDRMAEAHDEYIKERAYDIQDVARKITNHLLYGKSSDTSNYQCDEDTIFCNDFWSISDFVNIDLNKTKGIISANGGASSHIAILADSLNLPAVLGLESAVSQFRDGDFILIDGYAGHVLVNPSDKIIEIYKKEIIELEKQTKLFQQKKDQKVRIGTTNKHQISIGANLSMIVHTNAALDSGADMIGLYRTEFPFLVRKQMPTEEEQYLIYKRAIDMVDGKEITFRTLDIGGDKHVTYLNMPAESNPALGWRAIRFFLERKDLFRIQLRALLRASVHGKIRILFPMISSVEEIIEAKKVLDLVKKELQDENQIYARKIPIGAMIEVPSAVEMAGALAELVDFFSIGTNDLTQYCLAVDRTNPLVAKYYDPFHPAVLRMVNRTIQAAHKAEIKVTVCGDIASQPFLAALLIGMGADQLSMIPRAIPKIKYLARHIDENTVIKLAKKCLKFDQSHLIRNELKIYFKEYRLDEMIPQERVHVMDHLLDEE
ncbi:phosphoenolpyruvate--protein phosphotransferase, partial [bacterium K02(2017)]